MPVGPDPHLPPLLLLAFGLQLVAAVLAGVIAVGRHEHRPVAAFLGAMALAGAARWVVLTWWVHPGRASHPGEPLRGLALAGAHIDTALWLVWPAGLAAVAVAVYLRRRPWLVGAAWAMMAGAIISAYPTTRGDVLRRCYLAAELAAIVVSIGSFAMWTRLREGMTLPRACALLVVIFEFSTLLGPWIGDPFTTWWKAQILYSMLYAALIAIQGGWLWLRPSSRSE